MPLRYRLRFKQRCEGQQPEKDAELEDKCEVCKGQQPEQNAELEDKCEVCKGQQPEKDTEVEGKSIVCESHQPGKDAELEGKSTSDKEPDTCTDIKEAPGTLVLMQTEVAPQRARLCNLGQAASKCKSSGEEQRRSVAKDIAPYDSECSSLTRAELRKSTRKAPQANVQQKAAKRREREPQQMRPTAPSVTSKTTQLSGKRFFSEQEKKTMQAQPPEQRPQNDLHNKVLSWRPNVAAKREIKERLAVAQKRSKKAEDTGTGWWQLLDEMCSQDTAEEKPTAEEEPRATSPPTNDTAIVLREADNFRATSPTTSETAIVLREADNLSKQLAIVPRNPTLDDVPPGHIAYSKVKFCDHSEGTLYRFNYKGQHFQVTLARACNSDDHAARIARLMYMKCEEGFDKHAVISYRNELLAILASHWQRSGGDLVGVKPQANSSNKSRRASGAVGSSWASQLGTKFSRARVSVDPLDV